ncbi:hypothetical protein ColLi_08233 [Colletotrichum liriopes]|uniref:Uncharacterized protein n=1 Tax=Colletotrichum liriopes TaxID=708192 RepID=A0AA37GRC2_9PEZI|nr:hypothetical protein ColLi_08233 [Colletotrichum liriopes]
MQRPYVVGMLVRPFRRRMETQVLGVRDSRLLDVAFFQRQRRVGVPRWEHPPPRLGKGKLVLEGNGVAEPLEGLGIAAAPVLDLAIQHGARHLEYVADLVGKVEALRGHKPGRLSEELALYICLVDLAGSGMRDGLAVVAHDHGRVDERVVVVQPVVVVERVLPTAVLLDLGEEDIIGQCRLEVVLDGPTVIPYQDVDVRRHVERVPRSRDLVTDHVGRRQGRLGRGRHLHEVNVHVRDAGVPLDARLPQRGLEEIPDLQDGRCSDRLTAGRIEQPPRRDVHQRVGKQRDNVKVVLSKPPVHLPHGIRIRLVTGR